MKDILFGAALAASLLAAPAAAVQNDAYEAVGFTVSAKGYDLTRPDEVARLRDKVDRQIRRTCASQRTGTRLSSTDADRCRESMLASAAAQIDRQVRLAGEQANGANGG